MRDTRQFLTVLDAAKSYERKLRDYWGSAMIGYLPGNEASGTTAYDKSGNGRNGTLAGTNRPTFGAAGMQAEVEENIVELRASNPRAVIYYMNVLPRWTDVGGGTPVDKSAIRAAIAAACAAQGVTCWDTFTSPWITAAQTLDGLHPNDAGHLAILNQILARI